MSGDPTALRLIRGEFRVPGTIKSVFVTDENTDKE